MPSTALTAPRAPIPSVLLAELLMASASLPVMPHTAINDLEDGVLRAEIAAVLASDDLDVSRERALVPYLTVELCFRLRELIVEDPTASSRSQVR